MLKMTKRREACPCQVAARVFFLALLPVVLALISIPALADDPEARRIMEKVFARDDGDNKVWDMEMLLIDKDGKERVRKARCFSKDKRRKPFIYLPIIFIIVKNIIKELSLMLNPPSNLFKINLWKHTKNNLPEPSLTLVPFFLTKT